MFVLTVRRLPLLALVALFIRWVRLLCRLYRLQLVRLRVFMFRLVGTCRRLLRRRLVVPWRLLLLLVILALLMLVRLLRRRPLFLSLNRLISPRTIAMDRKKRRSNLTFSPLEEIGGCALTSTLGLITGTTGGG